MEGDLGLFRLSLLFGAGVIVFFAFNQFNQPSFEASKELERLIRFLKASDFRNRRVVWRAYAAYTAILLLIYLLICSYFTLPMLQVIGLVVPGSVSSAQSPVVPLMVSLAMVGLAPGIKPLQQFEEKIRRVAHYFSGIPARLVQGCKELKKLSLDLPDDGSGMLLPDADWKRLKHYRRHGDRLLDDPGDFAEDLAKIFVYHSWILKHDVCGTGAPTRDGIVRNDKEVEARIDRLVQNLDLLSGFHGGEAPERATGQSRAAWEELAAETDALAADVCAMLVLRIEHGLIAASMHADRGEKSRPVEEAEARLSAFLAGAGQWIDHGALVGRLWVRATMVVLPLAFVWGVFFGPKEGQAVAGVSAIEMGVFYTETATMIYSLSIFVALILHDRALRAEHPANRWLNMVTEHWTHWMGPVGWVLLVAWIPAVIGMVAVSVAQTSAAHDFQVEGGYWSMMLGALYYSGPRALLGPVLAIGVIASIDAAQAGAPRARWVILIVTVVALMLLGPALQALAIQYRDNQNYEMCLALGYDWCERHHFTGWGRLVAINAEVLGLIALRSGILGAAVLFVCQATLAAGPQGPRAREGRDRAALWHVEPSGRTS